MSITLTRRRIVFAAPAAIVAATIPTDAGAGPDAALLGLRSAYLRTLAAMNQASSPHSAAERTYFDMRTADPARDERSIRKASGLIVAERIYNRATDANLAVINQIAEAPARTVDGLIFKAQVSERESNMNHDLIESIVADLLAMGGAHA